MKLNNTDSTPDSTTKSTSDSTPYCTPDGAKFDQNPLRIE